MDKCVWVKVGPYTHWALYSTTCSPVNPELLKWEKTWNGKNYVVGGIFQHYKFCPFCGKEIEVKE